MKRVSFYLITAAVMALVACSSNSRHDRDNDNDEDSGDKQEQVMPSKTNFSKIENLPTGIEAVFGKTPSKNNGFYKFSFPRTDLKVVADGITIDPRLAFTSWFAFMPAKDSSKAMLMGDIVLLESELPAVEKKLAEEGIEITAIHNHLIGESPKVMYLHVGGMGNPVDLSNKLKAALALTATPMQATFKDQAGQVDWSNIEQIIGLKGKQNGPILSFGIPRKEKITEDGMELPSGFGISTGIAFQKSGNKTAITGDFVLMADEVNPVAKALIQHGITVTAIHNHMLTDNPRLFMMHFWAVDDPEALARGLKAALDKTNSQM